MGITITYMDLEKLDLMVITDIWYLGSHKRKGNALTLFTVATKTA